MKNKSPKDPAASVRARLLNHARQNDDDYQRVLTRYAIERLLFRLSQTEDASHYILKGAMLFATWPEHVFRPTGDLDLLGQGDPTPEAIIELFSRICQVVVTDDGIIFDPGSLTADPMHEDDEYQGVRLKLKGQLASAIITVQVDIGFGDHVYPTPKRETFPNILPDLPEAKLLMYPRETVVAEKFEAIIRFGEVNSRIKDYYDIWVTIRTFTFELSSLTEAVGGTLRRRDTVIPTDMPVGLSDAFNKIAEEHGLWDGFLRRNPPALQPPPFADLQVELRNFFGPVISGLSQPEAARGQWDPDRGIWR